MRAIYVERFDIFYGDIAGVPPDQQMELFRILSAILHLGNVNIQASGRSSDRSYIDVIIVFLSSLIIIRNIISAC